MQDSSSRIAKAVELAESAYSRADELAGGTETQQDTARSLQRELAELLVHLEELQSLMR
jgi:ABC-type phosphate/phosphonate transport system ATPase subunit